jgi:hypothetical protein
MPAPRLLLPFAAATIVLAVSTALLPPKPHPSNTGPATVTMQAESPMVPLPTLSTTTSDERSWLARAVVEDWPAALAWAEADGPPHEREDRRRAFVLAWGAVDFAAACTWVGQHPEPSERESMLVSLCGQLGDRDPAAALAAALDLPLGAQQPALVGALAARWVTQDAAAAFAWLEKWPEHPWRTQIEAHLLAAHSARDPRDAARRLAPASLGQTAMAESALTIAQRWAQEDAAAAVGWVALWGDPDLQTRAYAELQAVATHRSEAK